MIETEAQVTAAADEEKMSEMKSSSSSDILSGHESHLTDVDSNPAAKVKKAGELAVLSFKVGGEEILRGYIDKFVALNTTGGVIAFHNDVTSRIIQIMDYKRRRWPGKQVQSRQDSAVSNHGKENDENGSYNNF
jgi:hypothetical protein